MLQIVIALSAASPIVLRHRLVLTFRYWTATVFRLALGLIAGATAYFAVIFVLIKTYPLSHPFALLAYGVGFAVATLLAVIAGTLVSPTRLSKVIIQAVCTLAALFPTGLYFYFGASGEWHGIYLLYLAGSVSGVYAVARLTSWAGNVPHLCGI
jgi:hypothetical protein